MSLLLLNFDSLFQTCSRLWFFSPMSSLILFPFLILGQTPFSHFLDNPDNPLPFFHAISFHLFILLSSCHHPPSLTFSTSSWPMHSLFQHTHVFLSAALPRLSNLLFYHYDSFSSHAAFKMKSFLLPSSMSILEDSKFTHSVSIMFVF